MPPAFPEDRHRDGITAHDFGLPISACPYELNSDAGSLWRSGWLRAENWQREHEGRMGEPPERWEEAQRMVAADNPPDPCQEVVDNLEELARGDHDDELAQGGNVSPDTAWRIMDRTMRLLVRPTGAPANAWRDLGHVRSATFTATPPLSGKTDMLTDWNYNTKLNRVAVTLNIPLKEAAAAAAAAMNVFVKEAADALGALDHAIGSDTTPAVPRTTPKRRQTLCPSHGVELRGGGCPRCQREQQRRQNRRRR